MVLLTAADATSIVTSVTTVITDNMPAVIGLVAFGMGIKLFRSFANRGLHGKV